MSSLTNQVRQAFYNVMCTPAFFAASGVYNKALVAELVKVTGRDKTLCAKLVNRYRIVTVKTSTPFNANKVKYWHTFINGKNLPSAYVSKSEFLK